MKVSELIEQLKKMPQDFEVRIESSHGEYGPDDITKVYQENIYAIITSKYDWEGEAE